MSGDVRAALDAAATALDAEMMRQADDTETYDPPAAAAMVVAAFIRALPPGWLHEHCVREDAARLVDEAARDA